MFMILWNLFAICPLAKDNGYTSSSLHGQVGLSTAPQTVVTSLLIPLMFIILNPYNPRIIQI